MKPAATFALGMLAGIALALLLTSPTQSRQVSAPRPAATILATLRPVAPLRTPVPTVPVDWAPSGVRLPEEAPTPATPTTSSGAASATAAGDPVPTVAPTPTKRPVRPSEALRGVATFYAYHRGQAAAGPRLREEMGAGWRGETVFVNGVPVLLSDYMGTKDRDKVIDLDDGLFLAICGPLSLGICDVEIRW